ncbi:MAG: hypothetical protein HY547_04415 [Elusimicrobia bacterium]|nr:hypothetical protein [Elusimicrobiota bacterium]
MKINILPPILMALVFSTHVNAADPVGAGEIQIRIPTLEERLRQGESETDASSLSLYIKRAIDEITGECSGWTVRLFGQLFANGVPMAANSNESIPDKNDREEDEDQSIEDTIELVPISDEIINQAANAIVSMINDGNILGTTGPGVGASAAWGASFDGNQWAGGTMEFNPIHLERAQEEPYQRRTVELLRNQEILADSILHETAHIFYSYFKSGLGAEPAFEPARLTWAFQRRNFWDGSGLEDHGLQVTKGDDVYLSYNLSQSSRYADKNKGNEETARQVSHRIILCTQGAAVGRILGLEDNRTP